MALALDGSAQGSTVSSGTTYTVTLTTTSTSDIIVVHAITNAGGGTPPTNSISDTAGLSWTKRSEISRDTNVNIATYFYAVSTGALSSDVITVTSSQALVFGVAAAFGISGADTNTIFDSHSGLPVTAHGTNAGDPLSISTSNANDIILGLFVPNTANPTNGTGYTQIVGANFQLCEYKIVSAAQTALSVTVGTGAGTSNAGQADAIIQAPTAVFTGFSSFATTITQEVIMIGT